MENLTQYTSQVNIVSCCHSCNIYYSKRVPLIYDLGMFLDDLVYKK